MHRRTPLLALAFALSCALPAPATTPTTELVAPGLSHSVLHKGEVATARSYRILIGVFDRQSEADAMLGRLQTNGFSAVLVADGTRYRIVTQSVSNQEQAELMLQRLSELGFEEPLEIQEITQDLTHRDGPWTIHVLEADPAKVHVRVAHSSDAAIGLETTAELARRRGAVAAINGGYFQMRGLMAGDSLGALLIEGKLLSEPDRGRASVGFFDRDGGSRSLFGRLGFHSELRLTNGDAISLDGINRRRGDSEVVLYTPEFHRTTLTPSTGAEAVLTEGHITSVRERTGSSVIPPEGLVVSIGSERVKELLPRLRQGEAVSVETNLLPLLPDPEEEWKKAEFIVSGGPLLLWKGRRLEEPEKESISRVFFLARHPRTAVGSRADGTLLFVTVDGRRPDSSVGMSIPELTDLMLELGCESAINLDGGGSTTMVVNGAIVNSPSSSGGPRRNGDAILLFPRAEKGNSELGIQN